MPITLRDIRTAVQNYLDTHVGVSISRLAPAGGVSIQPNEMFTFSVTANNSSAADAIRLGFVPYDHGGSDLTSERMKELNDMHALAHALDWAAILGQLERNPAGVELSASDLIELSTRHNFAFWLAQGAILRGWARSASGETVEGISWIADRIRDYRATGSMLRLPYFLALKAEALHLSDRTPEALEAVREAEAQVEISGERWWCAELHRLRGVFLTAMGADETLIGASFCAAIRIAREQKSISLAKRAEATYAEYRRQKASVAGGRAFRLPLC